MPDGIVSTFGSYDFLSKSLPGSSLVLGLFIYLPKDKIHFPELSQNFLVLLSILFISILLGTLIGELVHTLANILEEVIAFFGRNIRKIFLFIANKRGWSVKPREKPSVSKRYGSSNTDDDIGFFEGLKVQLHNWAYNKYINLSRIALSHRKIFKLTITNRINRPYQSVNTALLDAPFTHKHMIGKMIEEYGIKDDEDSEEVYPVIVSSLANSGYNRAFKFQARYAFCRSMWLVFLLISLSFFGSIALQGRVLETTAFEGTYLFHYLTEYQITIASIVLFILSCVFAYQSGVYKRYYIQYLISETYANDNSA